jgi:hypothetical protein
MKHKFFASKLNTVLLLILIILMVIAITFMLQNKEVDSPVLENKQPESQEVKSTYTYTKHGFSIELPKGFIPYEEQAEGGPYRIITLPKTDPQNGTMVYIQDLNWWKKYDETEYLYVGIEKIGNTEFKKYKSKTIGDVIIYVFTQGNVGYQFGDVDRKLIESFKFVGWPKENNITWTDSPVEFGAVVSYPSDWQITPQHYGSPGMMAQGGKESLVGYSFRLPSGTWIMWGGPQSFCTDNEFGVFEYGVSNLACLRNLRTSIGYDSARKILSPDDLKTFGDFIVKNK